MNLATGGKNKAVPSSSFWRACPFRRRGFEARGSAHFRAFTIVELLIVVALIGTIGVLISSVFSVVLDLTKATERNARLERDMEIVYTVLTENLRSSRRIVAYEDYLTCIDSCKSDWILFESNESSDYCTYIGYIRGGNENANPDIGWADNGYIFKKKFVKCDSETINLLPIDKSGIEEANEHVITTITSLGQGRFKGNGVSVALPPGSPPSDRLFTISEPENSPAEVSFYLRLQEGVGTSSPLSAERTGFVTLTHMEGF